jgi:hypothetical protein
MALEGYTLEATMGLGVWGPTWNSLQGPWFPTVSETFISLLGLVWEQFPGKYLGLFVHWMSDCLGSPSVHYREVMSLL